MTTETRRAVEDGLTRYLRRELAGGALLARSTLSNVTILLTYRCPAACDHCLFESDNTKTATVDREVARRFIEAAARQQPPPSLSFSGGEPFLQLQMMRELASYAWSKGMVCEVISSSAWVKSREYAVSVLTDLKERGLRTYCTSIDRYHTPFVPTEKMRTAVLAAQEVGLRVVLNTMVDPRSLGKEREYLAATLELPLEALEQCHVNPLLTTPVGRARTHVTDYLFQEKDFREGCPFATEIVTLSPLGFVYPCCGMVLGEEPRDASLFIQDNLVGKSTDEIAVLLDDLKHDLFFRLLQAIGPYRLLQEVRRRNPELAMRERFIGSCDVCLEFTRNPEVAEATRDVLREYLTLLTEPPAEAALLPSES